MALEYAKNNNYNYIIVEKEILPESIELNSSNQKLSKGETFKLILTIAPDDSTNKIVTWTSSNPDVATVDENGLVKAVGYGNATITATTVNGKEASCKVVVLKPMNETKASAISTQTYTGKALQPTVTVKDGSKTLKNGTDYSYSVVAGKNVGKYGVKVTLKGNYTGSKDSVEAYTIQPATRTLKVVAGKKAITASYNKDSQVNGYQIRYATNSKMTSAKTVTVKGNSAVKKTINGLTSKKKYYVQVRSYKSVSYNGKTSTIYSARSTSRNVTVK